MTDSHHTKRKAELAIWNQGRTRTTEGYSIRARAKALTPKPVSRTRTASGGKLPESMGSESSIVKNVRRPREL